MYMYTVSVSVKQESYTCSCKHLGAICRVFQIKSAVRFSYLYTKTTGME